METVFSKQQTNIHTKDSKSSGCPGVQTLGFWTAGVQYGQDTHNILVKQIIGVHVITI